MGVINISENINTLAKFNIFANFSLDNIKHFFTCHESYYKMYKKNEIVLNQGYYINCMYIILKGSVSVEKIDILGNSTYLLDLYKGDLFGEQNILCKSTISQYTYKCSSDCKLLVIYFTKKSNKTNCQDTCPVRKLFTENLLCEIAKNNRLLMNKLEILSKKNLREKIMTFLINEAEINNSKIIKIPFNKSRFAQYLGVNRSALMREISSMKNDGLIEVDNITFTILF